MYDASILCWLGISVAPCNYVNCVNCLLIWTVMCAIKEVFSVYLGYCSEEQTNFSRPSIDVTESLP